MHADPATGSIFPGSLELTKPAAPQLGPGLAALPSRAECSWLWACIVSHRGTRHTRYVLSESRLAVYLNHQVLDFRLLMKTNIY